MFSSIFTLALIAGGAISASAQSISLSSQCSSTLTTIATSEDGQCINADSLISIAAAGNSSSIIQPLNTWLSGACSQSACSNQSISDIITNVTSGCSSDLASIGVDIDNSTLQTIISQVQQYYPTVRQIACLQDSSANELCVTETLNNVQSTVGTLSISNIISVVPQIIAGDNTTTLFDNVTCSSCGQEAYNIINSTQPGLLQSLDSNVTSDLQSQCGTSFTDGSTPSGISQTASGLSTDASDSSSAVSLAIGSSLASLVALASGFMVLA